MGKPTLRPFVIYILFLFGFYWSAEANPTGIYKEICLHEGVGLASADHECDHQYKSNNQKYVNMPYFHPPKQNHVTINPCQTTEEYLKTGTAIT